MVFLHAKHYDLSELLALYAAATKRMDEQGIPQWDEIYPNKSVLLEDIELERMYIGKIDGAIAVAFALEQCKDEDYEEAAWKYEAPSIVVLHRLCVHPAFQGQGVAGAAMDYLEQEVLSYGINVIRLDAFPQNPSAIKLYESRGYVKAGEITFRKGLFYLYEKQLS